MAAKDGVNATDRCLGFGQLTDLSSAQPLPEIPSAVRFTEVAVEEHDIRYREDGVAPTADAGMPAGVGVVLTFEMTVSEMAKVQFIAKTAGAKISYTFYS
jgi:hypothetical protein